MTKTLVQDVTFKASPEKLNWEFAPWQMFV